MCISKSMLSLFFFLFFFLPPNFADADWSIFQLTDDTFAESMPAIALDSSGNPHFAWCSNNDGDYDIYYLTEYAGTPFFVTDNSTEDGHATAFL